MRNIEAVKIKLLSNEIENLLEDFDINSVDAHGNNILHYYAKTESVTIDPDVLLKLFVDKGININAVMAKSPKSSALHLAVKLKKKDLVESLIKLNAKIDIVDGEGNTPLWQAVMNYKNDDPFYIRFLLSKGADKHIENKHGVSPLSLANVIANYDTRYLLN